jgi:hypothetical protein
VDVQYIVASICTLAVLYCGSGRVTHFVIHGMRVENVVRIKKAQRIVAYRYTMKTKDI